MNITDFFQTHSIDFRREGEHHHCTQGWVQIDCPKCSPGSGNFRLGWNLSGGYCSCWVCGKLNTYLTLSQVSNLPQTTIRKLFVDLEKETYREQKPPGILKVPENIVAISHVHRQYLRSRGFTYKQIDKLCDLWTITGFDYKNPKYAWSIFIPIIVGEEMISWTTRSTGDKVTLRYNAAPKNCEKFPAKSALYGIDYCQHSILICEGPLDAWKIGPGAVATMGTGYTKSQMLMASRFPNRLICFDKEPIAQRIAKELERDLMIFPGRTRNILLDSGKDPGECDLKELKQLKELLV